MPLSTWLAFLTIAATITVSPGPGSMLTLTLGASQGWRAAMTSACGLVAANLIYVFAAAMGLGYLLSQAPQVAAWMSIAGGVFLVKLGVDAWRAGGAAIRTVRSDSSGRSGLFLTGLMVTLGNMKLVALLVALLPPFVAGVGESTSARAALLALTYGVMSMLWHLTLAHLGARLGRWLARPEGRAIFRLFTALVFVVFGAALVVDGFRALMT